MRIVINQPGSILHGEHGRAVWNGARYLVRLDNGWVTYVPEEYLDIEEEPIDWWGAVLLVVSIALFTWATWFAFCG